MESSLKIGVVGFSRNQFDKRKAADILFEVFQKLRDKHPSKDIEIVSGYTNSGVPKIAYEIAEKFNFSKTGFSARQALNVKSGVYPVDKVILHGDKFSDESDKFVRYIDGLIRVGGGKQSRHETEMFKLLHQSKPLESLVKEFEVQWFGKM